MKSKILIKNYLQVGIFGIGILIFALFTFWKGIPTLFSLLGLHPENHGPFYRLEGKRALIITTSHDQLGTTGKKTGVFGSEMTAPYYAFLDGKMKVDVASISGGEIPIDPESFRWFIKSASDKRFLKDEVFNKKINNSLNIKDLDIEKYDLIFLAGGWGASYDLGSSEILGEKISVAWKKGKIIGGVCHGPLGLLLAKEIDGKPLLKGKRVTAVSNKQIRELGIEGITPLHPERELRKAGAIFESKSAFRDIFANHIVIEGRLITGQNQNAGSEVAHRMMEVAGGIEQP